MHLTTLRFLICSLWMTIVTLSLSAQQTNPVFDARRARHVITAESARQSVMFQNLLPGEIYSLVVPGGVTAANQCLPDLSVATPNTQVLNYDAASHVLRFVASSATMEFLFSYPCTWDASNPPRHDISLMRAGVPKELPAGISGVAPKPVSATVKALLNTAALNDTIQFGPDSSSVLFIFEIFFPCNDWTVTGGTSWLSASVSGNLDLYVSCIPNPSVYPRSAILTVTGCGSSMTYVVIQSGARLKTAPANADSLIRTVFRGGDCSDIQNVTFTGNNNQIGWFNNGVTSIGFNSGVIIATGNINVATGPNDQDGASAGFGNSTPDADLSQLTGGALFDMAAIEFDFTPTQSPVVFNFAFASEEYCEYVGSQYNDVFGFFISGPGIPNGQQNIALIPGVGLPVTINNVNHTSFAGYYVNNQPATSGNLCGQQPANGLGVNATQYDGFTKAFTAVANVQTCQTYHIKLKIADVGDGVWDSAVFLNAGSFDAGAAASVKWEVNGNPNIHEICEGCGPAKLVFERVGGNINVPLPVSFTVSGTATMGLDYSTIQSPIIIPAGQSKLELTVYAYSDAYLEGQETINITLNDPCSCLNPQVSLRIDDSPGYVIPPCPANNYPAADLCSDICIFCNFNGYMGTTSGYSGQTPPGFCGTIENEQWLGFIAGSGGATFTVTASNCSNGDGIQIALYPSCYSNPIICNGGCAGCANTPATITAPLTPGVNYYLMIDGYAGDQCDFTLNVTPPSAVQAPNVGATGVISGPASACPGATVTFSVPPVTGAGVYTWSAPDGSLINGQYPPVTLPAPGGNTIQVTIGPNSGTICVLPQNSCNYGAGQCKSISVAPIPPTTLPPVVVCNADLPYELPWGDWVSASGTYAYTYLSYQGCDSVINLTLLVLEPVAEIITNGALSCNSDTVTLNSTPSVGTKTWSLNGLTIGGGNTIKITQPGTVVLTVTTSATGNSCVDTDTLVITGNVPPTVSATAGVLGCGAAQAQINTNTNASGPTYSWSPSTGLSATNIANPVASLPGVYTVVVTDNSSGCTASTTVTVLGNTTAPLAAATGGTLNCVVTTLTVNALSNVQNPSFAWTGPNAFTSSAQNPTVNVPGVYTVTVTNLSNNCTATATATVNGDFTAPAAFVTFDPSLACGTAALTLDGSGSSTGPNYGYKWTANPGHIVSGATTLNPVVNPDGVYTLEVTDLSNGCTVTATANITCDSVPPWVVDTTGNNHTIILSSTMTGNLQSGDYVGVFFDSSGTLKCGGFGIWLGMNSAFAAYGNDATPPAQNGFKSGEVFKVKVWRPHMFPHEVNATAEYAPVGSLSGLITHTDKFAIDGISMITGISTVSKQTIPLKNGWNLISTYIIPDNPAMADIIDPVVSSIYIVKDCAGAPFYIPGAMINTFGDWDLLKGYQVNTIQPDTLVIAGQKAVPADHPIPLETGWQCIAYLRDSLQSIETVFAAIKGQIYAVKDGDGQVYLPSFNINNIGNMAPGKGYKVNALSDVVLTYQNNLGNKASNRGEKPQGAGTDHFAADKLVNTGNNATLVLASSVANGTIPSGNEIGVFSPAGKLCGAATFQGDNLAITVWGDDPGTSGIYEGMQNGEPYTLKIWNPVEEAEFSVSTTLASGSNAYQPDAIEVISNIQVSATSVAELTGIGIQTLRIFPNPASESLNIGIESNQSGLAALTIYNSNGMRVLDSREVEYLRGNTVYTLPIPATLSSGMYWFRFQFEKGIVYRHVFLYK